MLGPRTQSVIALTLLICFAALAARADVYEFTDERGVLHLSDVPRDARYRLALVEPQSTPATPAPVVNATSAPVAVAVPLGTASSAAANTANAAVWHPLIERAASRHNVAAALVRAVIQAESNFNPRAVSPKGAQGLMQLMPATAQRYGVTDAFDPEQNVHAGVRYLAELIALFRNDLTLALAAYNAGENAVVQYGNKVPPYRETQTYVPRVLEFYRRFQAGNLRI